MSVPLCLNYSLQTSGGSMISQMDGANPKGEGVNLIFWPKSCMKMKKIGPKNWGLASPWIRHCKQLPSFLW